jgi:4-hydroxy-3-methylbut-2-enyl diphosphate reductase IspH
LQIHGAPIYMRHEVVHNKVVTDDRRSKGAAKPRRAASRCSMQSARW